LRTRIFPVFDFSADANGIDDTTWQVEVVDPMIDAFLGQNLLSQPAPADVRNELMQLLTDPTDGLAKCGGPCTNGRTEIVTKAACASVLGSAALLLQ
jgi:hypothetical protein